ncbi:Inosine/uridine-preferring nucleoside hydrolase domain-containing protein [Camillea tinctor]|nr:Inosine/uridine-preferring nucleoside hydrolase domain-containing protein [Camillea tinctor]
MALLLALASSPEDIEVVMISVTYGNVPLEACLRNVVGLFHVLDHELEWRKSQGKPLGFEGLRTYKPIVAVGPEHALEDEILMADNFHGADGLHGVHDAHPHLSPADTWKALFKDGVPGPDSEPSFCKYFRPSKTPAHQEILRILREEPEGSISICAVGPLTNLALAASEDPETFLRVKEVAVMGGAVECEGNVTPVAEFNTYADAVATARLFALTSADPASTMPPVPRDKATLPPYPSPLAGGKRLNISLFPLDITTPHLLNMGYFLDRIEAQLAGGSPLGTWVNTFMAGIFRQIRSMEGENGAEPGLSLHDPVTVWYMLTRGDERWRRVVEDIRVETSGQWTHGMHVSDRRGRVRADGVKLDEIPGDEAGWLSAKRGNRINRVVSSPGYEAFAPLLMERLFG